MPTKMGAGRLGYWFGAIFGLRLISEGVDYYAGTPLSITLTGLLAALSLSGAWIACFERGMPRRLVPVLWGSAGLLVAAAVTFLATPDYEPATQGAQLLKYLAYVAVFLFCALYRWTPAHIKALLRIFILVMAVDTAVSVFQVATGAGWTDELETTLDRAFGMTSHPVMLGYKVFGMLAFALCFRQYLSRQTLQLFIVAGLVTLFLSQTRTAWILTALWALIYMGRNKRLISKTLLIAFISPFIIFALYSTGRFDDLSTLPDFIANRRYEYFNWRYMDSSFAWRLTQWYGMVRTGAENFWLGHGLGVSALLNEFDRKSHNSFIDFFVEGGIVGLVSFVFFLGALVTTLRRCVRQKVEHVVARRFIGRPMMARAGEMFRTNRATATALVLGYILAMAFGSSIFNDPLMMFLFFLTLGFICNLPFREAAAEDRMMRWLRSRGVRVVRGRVRPATSSPLPAIPRRVA